MSPEGKQALIAAVRRVVFAGLVLLVIWLILIALRGAIPESLIDMMNVSREPDITVPYDSGSWDWTRSLWTGKLVSELVGQRLGLTLSLIGLCGLFSLVIAAVLLSLGVLIRRATERPTWLARVRSILRLVLVSSGASVPVFAVSTIFIVFFTVWSWSPPLQADSLAWILWMAFFSSVLPTWLLVQAGHGELSKLSQNTPCMTLVKHLGIRLIIRLLRLVGVIIIVTISAGLGVLLADSAFNRDFPIIFSIVWVFVIIVTLVKLAAGLIEIVYNHLSKTVPSPEPIEKRSSLRLAIPKGWLIFSLGLAGISILVAVVGPLMAPYGYNEIVLAERLAPPSAEHLLGTDNLGRDILSRVLYGIRIDVLAGLACAGIISVLATGWAVLAVHFRRVDNWLGDTFEELAMLPGEIIRAFPWLVLLLFVVSIVMSGYQIVLVVLIISLALLPRAVIMIREAHRSIIEGTVWLKSLLRAVPVMFIFTVAGGIFYLSTLSYLEFGVMPPSPELGTMLWGPGRTYMLEAPWMAQWPLLCLALLLLTWVMAGDALLERLGFRSKAVWAKAME